MKLQNVQTAKNGKMDLKLLKAEISVKICQHLLIDSFDLLTSLQIYLKEMKFKTVTFLVWSFAQKELFGIPKCCGRACKSWLLLTNCGTYGK